MSLKLRTKCSRETENVSIMLFLFCLFVLVSPCYVVYFPLLPVSQYKRSRSFADSAFLPCDFAVGPVCFGRSGSRL